ncbi:mechanosensitive ion channel family protein [Patescibacteria group bacterium]|nr:mechanosensitive ion channel family protein [Patescibacteria group bacterium]MBU4162321.1 mechanosensitive ion channel family protein [Patescibacteria group bacterium]
MLNIVFIKDYLNQALSNRPESLSMAFWGNTLFDYLIALFVFIVVVLILRIFKEVIIVELRRLAKRTKTKFDDVIIRMIDSVGWPLYVLLSFYLSFLFLHIPAVVEKYFPTVIFVFMVFYIIKAIQILIDFSTERAMVQDAKDGKIDRPGMRFVGKIIKIIVWAFGLIIILRSFGYNITALAASLGIGGIAIAFALQNVLADIFASFSIDIDRPFKLGDFISIGEEMGKVKSIGIKSTRLQSLQGEELVISNKELTNSRIHNFGQMEKRRAVFILSIAHDTPFKKIEKIPAMIKNILKKIKGVEIDRVYFKELGPYNLGFEVAYFFNSADFDDFVEAREAINFGIKKALDKEKISMVNQAPRIIPKK